MDPKDPRYPPPNVSVKSPFDLPERVTAIELDTFNQVAISGDRACLVVIYGPELGKRAALGQGIFEIGRSSRSDLPIDQESISRHHARLSWDGLRHVIEDLGSTNGTFVNDKKIAPWVAASLTDGDRLGLGGTTLVFRATKGKGVRFDPTRAQKGCDAGTAADCAVLAVAYREGVVVQKDIPKAHALFEKSCTAGYEPACRANRLR